MGRVSHTSGETQATAAAEIVTSMYSCSCQLQVEVCGGAAAVMSYSSLDSGTEHQTAHQASLAGPSISYTSGISC